MSLKIGNVLKAIEEGRWVKVPAASGEFYLQIKQLLPGEQYALNARINVIQNDEKIIDKEAVIAREREKALVSKIINWRGLLDADGTEIPFSKEMLANIQFTDVLFACSVIGGGYLSTWLVRKVNKSDIFTEDADTSFLADT